MKSINKINTFLSPVTCAFIAVSLLVIIIVILVWPPATEAIINILGAMPAFLTALAGFIAMLRSKPNTPPNQSE